MAFGVHQMRRRGNSRRAPVADINVTPLVDVMLVLLVVFMVTAPLLNAGVPIDLPDSRAKALTEAPDMITLTLAGDGSLFLDQQQILPGQLAQRLASVKPGSDGKLPLVTLRADKSLNYGKVVAVMGELNRAGFNAISLVTGTSSVEPPLTTGSENAF